MTGDRGLGQLFGQSALQAMKHMDMLSDSLRYMLASAEYYSWHGKMPASDRTKRLRKKRRSIIMKWRYGK